MAGIRESISLQDNFTSTIDKIITRVEKFSERIDMNNYKTGQFVAAQNRKASTLRQAVNSFNTLSATEKVYITTSELSQAMTRRHAAAIDRLGSAAEKATSPMNRLMESLGKINKNFTRAGITGLGVGMTFGAGLVKMVDYLTRIPGKLLDIGDSYVLTIAKMTVATNSESKALQLNDLVFKAAQRARAEYSYMGTTVSRIGIAAGSRFQKPEDMVKFTETVLKSFTVAGATIEMQRAATLQLVQALGSGRLQGDEFRSVSEGAPLVLNALEKYMGVARGELKNLGAEGKITADILIQAMLAYSEEIDKNIEKMPITFGQAVVQMGNKFEYAFSPIFSDISKAAGSLIIWISNHMWEITQAAAALSVILGAMIVPKLVAGLVALGGWAVSVAAAVAGFMIMNPILSSIALLGLYLLNVFIDGKHDVMNFFATGAEWAGILQNKVLDIIKSIASFGKVAATVMNKISPWGPQIDTKRFDEWTAWAHNNKTDPNALYTDTYLGTGKIFDKFDQLKRRLQMTGGDWAEDDSGANRLKDLLAGATDANGVPVNVKGGKLDSVKIYDEDLVLFRDLATRDYQIKYSQVAPTVNMSFGDVHNNLDIDRAVEVVKESLITAVDEHLGGAPA